MNTKTVLIVALVCAVCFITITEAAATSTKKPTTKQTTMNAGTSQTPTAMTTNATATTKKPATPTTTPTKQTTHSMQASTMKSSPSPKKPKTTAKPSFAVSLRPSLIAVVLAFLAVYFGKH